MLEDLSGLPVILFALDVYVMWFTCSEVVLAGLAGVVLSHHQEGRAYLEEHWREQCRTTVQRSGLLPLSTRSGIACIQRAITAWEQLLIRLML